MENHADASLLALTSATEPTLADVLRALAGCLSYQAELAQLATSLERAAEAA